jgi:hypothetical protein
LNFQRLIEGNTYHFRIVGIVTGPEGEEYFKLKDPNGVKHLLGREDYRKYPFELNQEIQCKVDRINCTGRIYIEPLHPFYEDGKSYLFPVIRFDEVPNVLNEIEIHAILLDKLGYEINIPSDDLPSGVNVNDLVEARIIRIKKGRVYVSTDEIVDLFPELKHGDLHHFRIIGLKTYGEGFEFFILRDEQERHIKLRKKFYLKYGLRVGTSLYCRMIRLSGTFFFEPVHPVYQPGLEYEFEVIGQKKVDNYPDSESEVLVLKNPFGKEIMIPKTQSCFPAKVGDKITCRVGDIQKGEPMLDLPL